MQNKISVANTSSRVVDIAKESIEKKYKNVVDKLLFVPIQILFTKDTKIKKEICRKMIGTHERL